jgi:2,3-bisphosphoglycerate-independent phosphoglycerate mutase
MNKVILLILDGFGLSPIKEGNAIYLAKPEVLNYLWNYYPKTSLLASGDAVGLSWGEMGNSETGHLNLGAGRIVIQDFSRINLMIDDKSFFKNETLIAACENVKKNKSNLHLMGLFSPGGVHSHMDHLFALLDLAEEQKIEKVYLHLFTDGRDAPPKSALQYLEKLKIKNQKLKINTQIASICGRYYAMDRDNRWERTQAAYDAITKGVGLYAQSAEKAIENAYKQNLSDEFIKPTLIAVNQQEAITVKEKDSLIFFNYRSDRARQLIFAFAQNNFIGFKRDVVLKDIFFAVFVQSDSDIPKAKAAFPPSKIEKSLAEYLSTQNKTQLHLAETEKFAHVTYFFNGGEKKEFSGEKRILVPSPKVATYDLKPEMSVEKITQNALETCHKYDFSVINFANPDMVGHTGNLEATITAIKAMDQCIEKIVNFCLDKDIKLIITADHGNAEIMIDPITGGIHKEHTTNPVPFIFITKENLKTRPENIDFTSFPTPIGMLADVGPTILELLELEKPDLMTGYSLISSLS